MLNRDENFVPRWGSSTFECKLCGKGGMVWKELRPDAWRPYDMDQNKLHSCTVLEDEEYLEYQRKNTGSITLDSLIENLKLLGFEYFVPRTSSWKFALIKSNDIQTVYFLINRLGVDFKFYDYVRDTNIDNNGKLYTDEGLLIRNYYFGSDVNVHHLILRVANQLANDIPIDNTLLTGQGLSINKQRASSQALVDESWMQEIWEWADKYKLPEDTIPRNRAGLLALEKIFISKDKISFLPENIGKLSNLKSFTIWYCPLTTLPNSIGDLSSLEILDVATNELDSLPESIGNLKNLRELRVSGNKLDSLPESIGNLKNLQHFGALSDNLSSLPETLGDLSNLQYLDIRENKLDSLPESIGNLKNLKSLYVSDNKFNSLPEVIGSLSSLEVLGTRGNNLASLPESIGNLNNLKSLDVSNNNFVSPPEIIGSLNSLEVLMYHGNKDKTVPNTVDFKKVKLEMNPW
uniref:leucine-rich repeat domain-containing protein n=1 Tax=uncultured Psychrobacter sp. TaxID=259303 RepID=UPI002592FB39|nr:leucine-rich repeat domain-containing protein [uncultured Psychrobacter sp.]